MADKPSEHDENILNADRGKKLEGMIRHPGWNKVLEPTLKARRSAEITVLIGAKDHDEIIRAQQAIREIDGLFMLITAQIALGEQAKQKLEKE